MQNAAHNQLKKDRGNAQIAYLEKIYAECPDPQSMAAALFERWPQRLPKPVLRRIGRETKSCWVEIRAEAQMRRMVAMGHDMGDLYEQWRVAEIQTEAIERHGAVAEKIVALVESLPDVTLLTCSAVHPDDLNEGNDDQRSLQTTWDMADVRAIEAARNELVITLCMALAGAGGLIVRQQLKLRVQVPDKDGAMVWRPQERVFGVRCVMGEVTLLSERDVRQSYSVSSDTGEPIPLPPGTSFGDLKAHARQKRVSFGSVVPSLTVH